MKPMKEYLIGISLCAALLIAGGCSNENDIINSGNGNPIPLTIRATAGSFEEVLETGKSDAPATRIPTEDGNTTIFATGDAIGIFAIKDGAIVDGISNSKLTYSEGADGAAGSWNPEEGTALYWYEGVSYVAYYPYKDGITITPSQSTEQIIASLAGNGKLQPATDQSAVGGSAYTASDLMTASATSADITTNASGEKSLSLSFTHRFSLLVLVPRISEYIAPAGATYIYWGAIDNDAKSVTLNGITPYRMADGSFRAIVPPTTTSSTLHGNYKDEADRMVSFRSTPYSSGFTGGGCYTLTVARSQPGVTTQRAVAKGDFYMQPGMIMTGSKETLTEEEQTNCIGIVYKVGIGSGDSLDDYEGKLTAIHGYVLALQESWQVWGDGSKSFVGGDGGSHKGYSGTQTLLTLAATESKSFPACMYCVNYTPAAPVGTSGWYYPRTAQMRECVTSNSSALNTQLAKISGAASLSGTYSSCSDVSASQCWGARVGSGSYFYLGKGSNLTRAVFTF